MVLEVMQREVPVRGIGYLILRDCPEERLGEALGKGMEKLKKVGAKHVYATSLPEGEPLHDGPVGVWRLTHIHDMVDMERPLDALPKPERKLTLKPVKGQGEKDFLDLYNRSFLGVPNAGTYRPDDLKTPNLRHGLAYLDDALVGVYVVDQNDKTPVLAGLAIDEDRRRQGLGRDLLLTVLAALKAPVCHLTVSTANAPAAALCEGCGFTRGETVSEWFEVV